MNIYYVYQLVDPNNNKPFYIGKGTKDRAWTHNQFKDNNENPYKDRYIKKLHQNNQEPIVEIIKYFNNEDDAYDYEEVITESIGLENLTNIVLGARPPSKKGWKPSKKTLEKRSQSLKGIPRTDEWCKRLSESKKGKNNPMYGKRIPCSDHRKLAVLKGKNEPFYEIYKTAIELMNDGKSVKEVVGILSIGRGVCFRLKNRSHGFFKVFPELK
jgi:hypothetical protein